MPDIQTVCVSIQLAGAGVAVAGGFDYSFQPPNRRGGQSDHILWIFQSLDSICIVCTFNVVLFGGCKVSQRQCAENESQRSLMVVFHIP